MPRETASEAPPTTAPDGGFEPCACGAGPAGRVAGTIWTGATAIAIGREPTPTILDCSRRAMSITETVLSWLFATYPKAPSGPIAIPTGRLPTAIVATAFREAGSTTVTSFEMLLLTKIRPSGAIVNPSGVSPTGTDAAIFPEAASTIASEFVSGTTA